MLHMPNPMLLNGADAYERFLTHIVLRQTGGVFSTLDRGTNNVTSTGGPYTFVIGVDALQIGTRMFGTSWGDEFARSNLNAWERVLLHGFPSLATYQANIGRSVFVSVSTVSARQGAALNRNGFQSESADTAVFRLGELTWFDASQGLALTSSPFTQTAPVEYSF